MEHLLFFMREKMLIIEKNMVLDRNIKFLSCMLLILVLFSSSVWSGDSNLPDSLKQNHNSLVALPYAYYTPETKIAFGLGGIYSFRPSGGSPEDRPSNVRIALTYTQLKQTILGFLPEIYIKNESYYLNGYYGFFRYPDKFWGIGNDTPDSVEEEYEPNYFNLTPIFKNG